MTPSRVLGGVILWKTVADLTFVHVSANGLRVTYTVQAGFETDLASIPRLLWWLFPPHSPDYAPAAVLHDCLSRRGPVIQKTADGIFYDAMVARGVVMWRRRVMYRAVRAWQTVRPAFVRMGVVKPRERNFGA